MTPRFIENIHLDIPKPITINHDEFGKTECSVINKFIIQQVEEIEDKLLESIRGMAIANGIDDVFVIDKKAVLSALEKQIPKKPIEKVEKDYEGNIFDVSYNCPVCTRTVCLEIEGNFAENYPYCHCGQALDWSDTE